MSDSISDLMEQSTYRLYEHCTINGLNFKKSSGKVSVSTALILQANLPLAKNIPHEYINHPPVDSSFSENPQNSDQVLEILEVPVLWRRIRSFFKGKSELILVVTLTSLCFVLVLYCFVKCIPKLIIISCSNLLKRNRLKMTRGGNVGRNERKNEGNTNELLAFSQVWDS